MGLCGATGSWEEGLVGWMDRWERNEVVEDCDAMRWGGNLPFCRCLGDVVIDFV